MTIPWFYELAEARLSATAKTLNIKVTKATAKMMIERERRATELLSMIVATIEGGGPVMTVQDHHLQEMKEVLGHADAETDKACAGNS